MIGCSFLEAAGAAAWFTRVLSGAGTIAWGMPVPGLGAVTGGFALPGPRAATGAGLGLAGL
ncbi:hypothetical protein, partial [Novosphingobium sp. B-7]|uniref:hypothetical protein n=1 Tax=Novosphingobium sp. B-7 TaxID=1298855 RepID=UPI001ED99155